LGLACLSGHLRSGDHWHSWRYRRGCLGRADRRSATDCHHGRILHFRRCSVFGPSSPRLPSDDSIIEPGARCTSIQSTPTAKLHRRPFIAFLSARFRIPLMVRYRSKRKADLR